MSEPRREEPYIVSDRTRIKEIPDERPRERPPEEAAISEETRRQIREDGLRLLEEEVFEVLEKEASRTARDVLGLEMRHGAVVAFDEDASGEDGGGIAVLLDARDPELETTLQRVTFRSSMYDLEPDARVMVVGPEDAVPDPLREVISEADRISHTPTPREAATEVLGTVEARQERRRRGAARPPAPREPAPVAPRGPVGVPPVSGRTRAALTPDPATPTLTPEQREAIIFAPRAKKAGGLGRLIGRGKAADRKWDSSFTVPAPGDFVFPTFPKEMVHRLKRSRRPATFLFGANKGGVGKTTLAANYACVLERMGYPKGSDAELKVLLVDQNFGNSDIRDRLRLRSGELGGLKAYLRSPEFASYLRSLDTDEESPAPDLSPYVHGTFLPNLDVLAISDEDDTREVLDLDVAGNEVGGGGSQTFDSAFQAVEARISAVLEAASRSYDALIVDLANCKPKGRDPANRLLWVWASAADVIYLVLEAVNTSHTTAELFVAEARHIFADGEVPLPVVPILNMFPVPRPGDGRWLQNDLEAGRKLEAEILASVGADAPVDGNGDERGPLKIPRYDEVTHLNNEGRVIAFESERLARAFVPAVIDGFYRACSDR